MWTMLGRLIVVLLLVGCESSNTNYYYVCLSSEMNYKRGAFYGFIYPDGAGNTVFVDAWQRVTIVPGLCIVLGR